MRPGGLTQETRLGRVRRARRILRLLAETYPDAHCELDFSTPLELAVATILSAQCTDQRVNMVTPQLFARYPDAAALAAAEPSEVAEVVRSTGFFRAKADNLVRLGRELEDRYDGILPGRMSDLVTLPGIGRKTANVILGNAFGVPGFAVDTHVLRLSRRLGLTESDDPVTVERDITDLLPRKTWTQASHLLIWHGSRICHARRPACGACPVGALCPSYGIGPTAYDDAVPLVKPGAVLSSQGAGP